MKTRPRCECCYSQNIIKFGTRKTKRRGKIQRYKCEDCNKTFTINDGFKHNIVTHILYSVERTLKHCCFAHG